MIVAVTWAHKGSVENELLFLYSIAPGLWCSRKGLELLLSVPIKAIPLKVFVRWGAGKKNFFQKGLFPA